MVRENNDKPPKQNRAKVIQPQYYYMVRLFEYTDLLFILTSREPQRQSRRGFRIEHTFPNPCHPHRHLHFHS